MSQLILETLSNHILDLVENSIEAKARNVSIFVLKENDLLTISVEDDGCGMDEDTLNKSINPSFTTKVNGRGGEGIPLFKQEAVKSGGSFRIESIKGKGTKTIGTFVISKNLKPFGEIGDNIIVALSSDVEINLKVVIDNKEFETNTKDLVKRFGNIKEANTQFFVKNFINTNLKEIGGSNYEEYRRN